MNLYKKILDTVAKIAAVISMIAVLVMVSFIVMELIRRNIFNRSFRPTIEICGISFLWMAFMGIIPLYNQGGLMRLDFLISRVKGPAYRIMVLMNKLFSLMLGVIMVVAFCAQYPFVSTRFYSTFAAKVPYSVQYFPMAVSGAFMALKALQELAEWCMEAFGGKRKEEQG